MNDEITPEEYLGFQLHWPGYGHIPVSELVTLDELRAAFEEARAPGMYILVQLRFMQRTQ